MENHGEMEKGTETVILEIEGTKVECDKNLLIKHSDYFSAMFTGNFKERFLKTVKIHDVDLKSFITIQTLIKDAPKTLIIEEAEILCIMHAACILQFSAIRNLCIRRIEFLLKPSNCVNIWKSLELLGVSPLWLKAKCMALMNFDSIKDSNELLEFSIDEICSYLGNVYLYVQNEFSVFRIAMNWWHENQNAYIEEKTKTLLRLINCINFKVLTSDEIGEMQSYSDILNNTDLVAILKLVGELLENHSVVEAKYSSDQLQYAKHLYNSHGRKLLEVPCILFQIVLPVLKSLEEVTNHVHCKNVGVYCNKKNCKFMENIGACFPLGYFAALAYDSISNNFKPCIDMKRDLIKDLGGFKIVSYKEFLVFFGGEYVIGAGKWNFGVWVYDAFKEMWHQISVTLL
ncbi:kelch-like protein 30 [Anthonomus grandis grandis]|uniref:kelch-like protein 30 n=1 Tax=Anthonomus grandis grandis TaxID=2921223 RepID=UPI0021669C23|nr:kelch-like protein 30 [Anthonomus grandis grandis]